MKKIYVGMTGVPVWVARAILCEMEDCAVEMLKNGKYDDAADLIYEIGKLDKDIRDAETEESEGADNE